MGGARVVAVVNQKGGVGKTTTAVNLAAALGRVAPVLLLDLDPQANATASLGMDARSAGLTTYEVLLGAATLEQVARPSGQPGVDLGPGSPALAGAQVELVSAGDWELRLRRALESAPARYAAILIDCPPSLGVLTLNALAAADAVLIPVQCEYLALEGLGQLMEIVAAVREQLNPHIEIFGL